MGEVPEANLALDFYNTGPAIDVLESKMANLLGKEKALFVQKGMVGQNSALMEYAKRSGSDKIAIHPESLAYQELMGLNAIHLGKKGSAIEAADIAKLPTSIAAVCVELPTRRAGFKLPEWQTLQALKDFSVTHNIPIHFDGARLFESADYWQKSPAEVAALSDSVYVSLYKMLGAAAGGIIAGSEEFIESLKPWRSRFGGDMFTAFPYVLSALWGLEHYLPRISEFNPRAQSLSQLIAQNIGAEALPDPVQTCGFIVELQIDMVTLEQRALALAENERIWLFDRLYDAGEDKSRFEVQVGDALDHWSDTEVVAKLMQLLD
ncbi:MAG: threonine aldolase family protein [Thalassotalea sp.]|nr:threonine aldolase family protein [Thalassotalea sp.]